MPSDPAANIQNVRLLFLAETTADELLLFGTHVKEITAGKIHAGAIVEPYVKYHVAVGMPQLVEHRFGKGLHLWVELVCLTRNKISGGDR
jgi:hypothetical protein